jgi:hypothetical protein
MGVVDHAASTCRRGRHLCSRGSGGGSPNVLSTYFKENDAYHSEDRTRCVLRSPGRPMEAIVRMPVLRVETMPGDSDAA